MAKDANYTKTPQSGSKPPYTEPTYTKTAATIPQKLRNNKGRGGYGFPDTDSGVGNGRTNTAPSPGGGSTSNKGRGQTDKS